MDELWQRYRAFWLPVLYGVGAFLAGLIVVHIVTPDPEAGQSQNAARVRTISNFTAPTAPQMRQPMYPSLRITAELETAVVVPMRPIGLTPTVPQLHWIRTLIRVPADTVDTSTAVPPAFSIASVY